MKTNPLRQRSRPAQLEIFSEGRMSPDTIELSAFLLKDPTSRGICERIAKASGVPVGVILGAYVSGCHLGLKCRKADA